MQFRGLYIEHALFSRTRGAAGLPERETRSGFWIERPRPRGPGKLRALSFMLAALATCLLGPAACAAEKVMLGGASLTAGIPGSGPITLEEIERDLDNEELVAAIIAALEHLQASSQVRPQAGNSTSKQSQWRLAARQAILRK